MQPTVYLDTSVLSFLLAEDRPDWREATGLFFKLHGHKYQFFISEVVLLEIDKTTDPAKREQLVKLASRELKITLLPPRIDEVSALARAYSTRGVVPPSKIEDGQHLAYATINAFDILLTWNFRHLVNANRWSRLKLVNQEAGFNKRLRICTPLELMNE